MTNSEQELQQLNMFLVLPLLVCFVILMSVLTTPDSTHGPRPRPSSRPSRRCSCISASPSAIPAHWEIVASIALTSASIYAIVWVTSRIYRVGVLMYGKRPTLPELLRWLKYS